MEEHARPAKRPLNNSVFFETKRKMAAICGLFLPHLAAILSYKTIRSERRIIPYRYLPAIHNASIAFLMALKIIPYRYLPAGLEITLFPARLFILDSPSPDRSRGQART